MTFRGGCQGPWRLLSGGRGTFDGASRQFLSLTELLGELLAGGLGEGEECFERVFSFLDELGLGDEGLPVLVGQFLLRLVHPLLHEVLYDGLVPDFPLQFLVDLPLCVSDDPLHHLILLFHFPIFKALDLPQFFLLPAHAVLPLHPLLGD